MKKKKVARSTIIAYFHGGSKLRAETTHTPEELKEAVFKATEIKRPVEIDTVNEDAEIDDDVLTIATEHLMFWSIITPKASDIVIASADAVSPAIKGTVIR